MPERDDIKKIQQRCYELDDELRWLLAFISDTGLRLSEAVGLAISDIKLVAVRRKKTCKFIKQRVSVMLSNSI